MREDTRMPRGYSDSTELCNKYRWRIFCSSSRPRYSKHSGVYLSESLTRTVDKSTSNVEPNYVVQCIEYFYEYCAGYNLRYCPLRGFIAHSNDYYFSHMVKDIIILLCFLIANFIVFLNVLVKTMIHTYLFVYMTTQWIKRTMLPRLVTDELFPVTMPQPTRLRHDLSPKRKNKSPWSSVLQMPVHTYGNCM
ncbi:unnamed protein product [Spodoptera littoralis]|uniref:Uncharacterized protein n=1 Tax=Spodoptera littoralis TaxID=7109 RepID=A0A9P0IIL5_SPOLI|nr:unnamed protein product [Spodoptera littoralis]CAH1647376.1 unnamed protein product [Spodoptera littoralis]